MSRLNILFAGGRRVGEKTPYNSENPRVEGSSPPPTTTKTAGQRARPLAFLFYSKLLKVLKSAKYQKRRSLHPPRVRLKRLIFERKKFRLCDNLCAPKVAARLLGLRPPRALK